MFEQVQHEWISKHRQRNKQLLIRKFRYFEDRSFFMKQLISNSVFSNFDYCSSMWQKATKFSIHLAGLHTFQKETNLSPKPLLSVDIRPTYAAYVLVSSQIKQPGIM